MNDLIERINKLPPIGASIRMYGRQAKVIGYKITDTADYVVADDGVRQDVTVHIDNLKRLEMEGDNEGME